MSTKNPLPEPKPLTLTADSDETLPQITKSNLVNHFKFTKVPPAFSTLESIPRTFLKVKQPGVTLRVHPNYKVSNDKLILPPFTLFGFSMFKYAKVWEARNIKGATNRGVNWLTIWLAGIDLTHWSMLLEPTVFHKQPNGDFFAEQVLAGSSGFAANSALYALGLYTYADSGWVMPPKINNNADIIIFEHAIYILKCLMGLHTDKKSLPHSKWGQIRLGLGGEFVFDDALWAFFQNVFKPGAAGKSTGFCVQHLLALPIFAKIHFKLCLESVIAQKDWKQLYYWFDAPVDFNGMLQRSSWCRQVVGATEFFLPELPDGFNKNPVNYKVFLNKLEKEIPEYSQFIEIISRQSPMHLIKGFSTDNRSFFRFMGRWQSEPQLKKTIKEASYPGLHPSPKELVRHQSDLHKQLQCNSLENPSLKSTIVFSKQSIKPYSWWSNNALKVTSLANFALNGYSFLASVTSLPGIPPQIRLPLTVAIMLLGTQGARAQKTMPKKLVASVTVMQAMGYFAPQMQELTQTAMASLLGFGNR